ncbi:MAG: hypothetical protein J6P87_00810 [Lachnospiraceae bacterium]|nr:hypothetical protein [Lachnospiraceae bacterium]
MDERTRIYHELVQTIVKMGYPEEFGKAVANNLRSEKTMSRMIGYLHHAKPRSAEEIADEMLAIMDDRERWIRKKEAEFYNSKYNELLYYGLGNDEEEDDGDGD